MARKQAAPESAPEPEPIELACADPSLELLDFGPGEADYKRMFSSESRQERPSVTWYSRAA